MNSLNNLRNDLTAAAQKSLQGLPDGLAVSPDVVQAYVTAEAKKAHKRALQVMADRVQKGVSLPTLVDFESKLKTAPARLVASQNKLAESQAALKNAGPEDNKAALTKAVNALSKTVFDLQTEIAAWNAVIKNGGARGE